MGVDNVTENPKEQPLWDGNTSDRTTHSECERVLDLIPAFSIGATDPDDEEFIKARLVECPEATLELAKYMKLAEALHYSAAHVQARPVLANHLRTSLQLPPTSPGNGPLPRADTVGPPTGSRRVMRTRSLQSALILNAGILCLLLISNIYWLVQIGQIRSREDQITTRMHNQDTALMLLGL